MDKKALLTVPTLSGELLPEAVSFDGDTDYLSRSTAFTGDIDSKTFTFSCWFYSDNQYTRQLYNVGDGTSDNWSTIDITESALTIRFNRDQVSPYYDFLGTATANFTRKTWNHLLISIDTANSSHTVYLNDDPYTLTVTVNENVPLKFSVSDKYVMANYVGTPSPVPTRLSNLFLDYNYRDLSIEANRRLFITADGKPAVGQAALNPILYLPMKDKETAHSNEGTGGDFVQNGTLETAQRGPNQDNCVASEFTASDFMTNTSIADITSSGFTISFNIKSTLVNQIVPIWTDTGTNNVDIQFSLLNTGVLRAYAYDYATATVLLNISITNPISADSTHSVQISIDTVTQGNNKIYIDGSEVAITVAAFVSRASYIVEQPWRVLNAIDGGTVGEIYLDTTYMDLSASNPFWDSTTNKPVPVRKVIENTGVQPLIAMPISADDPELNLGTGGDFTLTGGPLVGARGASEFWARSIDNPVRTATPTSYLVNNSMVGTLDSGWSGFICTSHLDTSVSAYETMLQIDGSSLKDGIHMYGDAAESQIIAMNQASTEITFVYFVDTGWRWFFFWYNPATSSIYLYGLKAGGSIGSSVINIGGNSDSIDLSGGFRVGAPQYSTYDWNGSISSFYFVGEYINFSEESNRNLFLDQLGYPVDLQKQIDNELIPNPLVYLPFDDPDNLGKNNGTGGDFTVVGTVTQGSDVDPNA